MTNASTQKWINKLRPPVISSIPGGTGYVAPGVTTPTPTVTPPVTATSTNPVASSVPGFPKATVATKETPVVDMSKPKVEPAFNQYDTSVVAGLDQNGLQDFIDQTNIDVRRGTPLTPEREAQLYKAQRRLQELSMPQAQVNPYEAQIAEQEKIRKQKEQELASTSQQLIDKRRAELEAQYGAKAGELQQQGAKTMNAAQGVLSFSGFGRSTYAADKQAEIQDNVNKAQQSLVAEKDYAIAKYQAELAGADAETLASYDESINQLRQQNAQYKIGLAQAMNEYNQQTGASYQEKIDNIFKLAQQNAIVDLTDAEKQQASSFASLLIDAEGNVDTKLLEQIPARLANEALIQASVLKSQIQPKVEAPKTASDGAGNLYQFNDKTGQWETIGSAGKEFKTVGEQAYAFDPTTGQATMVTGGATGDLRGLASQFPGQARAKNNNPAGITWNANFDSGKGTAALLQQAGIAYEKGTARPSGEGGNYVSFPTIEDGLAAQRILMTQTYGNNTVQDMLGKRVGTGEALNYAKQVAGNAGVPLNIKVNQLNEQQIQQLQMAKIQKESPGLAKLLNSSQPENPIQPSGTNKLPAGEASSIGEIKAAKTQADNLSNIIDTYKDVMGPISGRLGSVNLGNWNAEQQKANAEFSRVTQIIGKSLEGGKLAEGDINRYLKMLPAVTDTPEVAKSKISSAQAYLNTILEQKIKALGDAGYNVKNLYMNTSTQPQEADAITKITPQQSKAYDDLRNSL